MAVEKMKMMNLVALKKDAQVILEQIVLNGSVHIGNNPSSSNFTMGYANKQKGKLFESGVNINSIIPYQSNRTYEKKQYKDLLDRLFLFIGINEQDIKKIPLDKLNVDSNLENLDELDEQATTIRDYEMAHNYAIEKMESFIRVLNYFENSDVSLSSLLNMKHIKVYMGEVPRNSWKKIKENYENIKGIVVHIGSATNSESIMFFSPVDFSEEAERFLQSVSFDEIKIPKTPLSMGELIKTKKSELEELKKQKIRIEKAKEVFIEMYKNQVETIYCRYKIFEKIEYLEENTAESENFMIFSAFIPESEIPKMKNSIESKVENAIISFDSVKNISNTFRIPTKLKNNPLIAPFEALVNMYSTPSYTELDPTPFFAITYMLLFGLMFGDVGQGFVMIFAGFKFKKTFGSLSDLIKRLGFVSTIFGFLYGSVFGLENLLPAILIRPMEEIDIILLSTVALGIVLVTIAYLIGFHNLWKNKKYADLFFDKNGISGFLFYLSFLLLAFNTVLGEKYFSNYKSIITIVTTTILIVTACLMIMKLKLKPSVEKIPEGEKIEEFSGVESGFEMFETVMSFFSNTLSFIRVGAFAINHAGLFMAFHALGQMIGTSAGNLIMIIIGNIVILSLEALIVFIQAIRLEYYELFSKYFIGGGEPYNPLKVEFEKK